MFNELYSPDKHIAKMYNLTKIHKCNILKNRHEYYYLYVVIKDCFFAKFLFENNLKVDNVFIKNNIFEYNGILYIVWKNRFKKITIADGEMFSVSLNHSRSIRPFNIRFQTKKQVYEFKKLCIKDKLKR